jgi:uncharacterized protein
MAIDQPLSAAERDELAEFLESDLAPDEALNICMLHGYLTAIAIGPVTLMPSQWLPGIWGEAGEPAFSTLERAQHILNLIIRFYNEIVGTFMETPEQFLPDLYEYEENGEQKVSAEEWCIGFSMGVHLRSEAWDPLLEDEELSGLLAPIVAFSMDEVWDEVTAGQDPVKVREKLIAALPTVVQAIHAYWLPFRKKIMSGLTPDSFPFGGSPKVGRNEPCPCGSGKKFKKCCGAARVM